MILIKFHTKVHRFSSGPISEVEVLETVHEGWKILLASEESICPGNGEEWACEVTHVTDMTLSVEPVVRIL